MRIAYSNSDGVRWPNPRSTRGPKSHQIVLGIFVMGWGRTYADGKRFLYLKVGRWRFHRLGGKP